MIWFVGVVEDNNDPAKLGRLKVRCLGYHTENKDDLLTSDLPWASVMQPITSAAVQGIGQSPTGIVQGTHVVGFFRDGKYAQDPVVMGTLAGASGAQPQGIFGFADQTNLYEAGDVKADFPIKTYLLPSMALHKYVKLGIDDNATRTFGDPAYIKLPIAKVV